MNQSQLVQVLEQMTDSDQQRRHRRVALPGVLLLLWSISYGQAPPPGISLEAATRVALTAAGCKKPRDCIAKARKDKTNWMFVITYVEGRDAAGNPLTRAGGWVGITVDSTGHVIDKMPGD